MFEGVLYFVLGFLASALIALMISPAIWNRAVVLTKRRIESSVPLTLNEVQDDKDQLRAEFAMSTRRLELSIEQLQEKAARQVIEINRKRDELAKLAEEGRTKIRTVEDLDARGADLRARLAQREEQLEKTGQELDRTRQQLDKRGHELEEMQSKLTRIQNESDSHRIELVAKQTSLDDVSDQVSAAEARRKSLEGEVTELRATVKRLEADLASAKARGRDAEERAERTRTLNSQLEENLEAGERNVSRLRAAGLSEDESSNELTRLLMEER